MKVYVFGANGMLGKYLTTYLKSFFEVIPITRKEIDLMENFEKITDKYIFQKNDVIINAAGIIKQRSYDLVELIRVNSLFPHFLSTIDCNVIHVTTDCVFSGSTGLYLENYPHDCTDDYGKSKSLGEPKDITVIRTSIIGEELSNKRSLLEWVRSNKNSKVNGFINHFWNGLTCLELSKQIKNIISTSSYWKGVKHYFSPNVVSKYQLVKDIGEIYNLNIEVIPHLSYHNNRSLSSNSECPVSITIHDQIQEMEQYSLV